jgi:hypothetical protein
VTNSIFSSQDAEGSIRRGVLLLSCSNLAALNSVTRIPSPKYTAVRLLAQLVNVPNYTFLHPGPYCSRVDLASGGRDN